MDDSELFTPGTTAFTIRSSRKRISTTLKKSWTTFSTNGMRTKLSAVGRFIGASASICTRKATGRGILKSAYEHNVPVFVPAFSAIRNWASISRLHKIARQSDKRPLLRFDPFEDFEKFADTMLATKRMGIFTVGGGVPRNWSQQFGVYAELLARRGYKKLPLKRYNYGVRICPEPVHWGGLSGSTYTEAVSWGKFVPPEEGGKFAEVFDDATVALPLIVGAVLERIGYFKRTSTRIFAICSQRDRLRRSSWQKLTSKIHRFMAFIPAWRWCRNGSPN